MPYKAFKEGAQWCVYTTNAAGVKEGDPHGCFDSKTDADTQVAALYANSDENLVDEERGYGYTVVAIAGTNEPFIGLKNHPVSIESFGGVKVYRVPFLIQGIYAHPWYGTLDFNQRVVNQILRNHALAVTEQPVYYRVGHFDNAAMAFFDTARGGWFDEEIINGDKLAVAYGPITDEAEAEKSARQYVCSSMDLDRMYRPSQLMRYSKQTDSIITFNYSWSIRKEAIFVMPVKKKFTFGSVELELEQVDGVYHLSEGDATRVAGVIKPLQDQLVQFQTDMAARDAKIVQLEARVKELEPEPEVVLPQAVKDQIARLEKKAAQAEEREFVTSVDAAVQAAANWRDNDGNGHSQVFIDWMKNVLLGKEVGSGEDVVKLENSGEPYGWRKYIFSAVLLLARTQPGVVPAEGKSNDEAENNKNPMRPTSETTELAQAAKNAVAGYSKRHGLKIEKKEA